MGNIDQFKKDFHEYQVAKENYIIETISFESILNDVYYHHTKAGVDNDILSNENDAVLTHEGVNMENGIFLGGDYSNRFIQVGLDELKFESTTITHSQIFDVSQITPDISFIRSAGYEKTCRNVCDGYTKMKNKPFYGLEIQDDTSQCNCYVMDYKPELEKESLDNIKQNGDVNVTYGVNQYAVLYDISDNKYKVGENLSKRGYIGYDGKFYDTKDMSSDVSFEKIPGFCLHKNNLSTNQENLPLCENDSNCIGYLIDEDSTRFNINDSNKHFLYDCSFKDSNDYTDSYYHKKYTLGSDYPNCIQDPSYTKLISYHEYDVSLNDEEYNLEEDKCGFDYLLKNERQSLIEKRKILQEIIKKVIISFNKLTEKELELLNNIKLKDIDELKLNYNKLRDKAQNQHEKFPLIKRQTKDSEILYKSIQYKTALVGVVSIMAIITLFHINKK